MHQESGARSAEARANALEAENMRLKRDLDSEVARARGERFAAETFVADLQNACSSLQQELEAMTLRVKELEGRRNTEASAAGSPRSLGSSSWGSVGAGGRPARRDSWDTSPISTSPISVRTPMFGGR